MSQFYPCKESISHMEYLAVTGLLVIGKKHRQALEHIEQAIADIIGVARENNGHVSDALWQDYTADELLEKMECKVMPADQGSAERSET